ncbi:class II fumarate hydratase [Candidatus Peregrinibacteria bacterium]|nr:class II fumarate hydratase [Candidatus Peregrinibacteria bacterium]
MPEFRTEKDAMGEIKVPKNALYGAQTERAVRNFQMSGIRFSRDFIAALGMVKLVAAQVNFSLKLLDKRIFEAIQKATEEVLQGKWDAEFPLDIFQTGSGTSTNMNANEVIANRAMQISKLKIHPNDHVNLGQSSNDVIPTAIRIAGVLMITKKLLPALHTLEKAFQKKSKEYRYVITTGRTHLMDATAITLGQRFSGYERQMELSRERIQDSLKRLRELPQGGTAVGTGINTHPKFGKMFAEELSKLTKQEFFEAKNHFEAQASIGAVHEMHTELKILATELIKIANDIRWMNSGPNAGLGEIQLFALQPGSSIMPGKVNPVIEESVIMTAMKVLGNDLTIELAAQSGNFELNTALPVTAHALLESITLLTNACDTWTRKSIEKLTVRKNRILDLLHKNPILATALNPLLGYENVAKIIKTAIKENRSILDVTKEMHPKIPEKKLRELLDPRRMT